MAEPGQTHADESEEVSRYILERFVLVCDPEEADVDALGYLEMLYFRVKDDKRILPELRSLPRILDKLEEDLAYSREIFGERYLDAGQPKENRRHGPVYD